MALWVIGTLVAIVLALGLALQIAISRNGPAVLNAVDRITGGARDTVQKARISTGEHDQQKLIIWGPDRTSPGTSPLKTANQNRDPEDSGLPVIIFVHGGSWANGDPVDYGFIARAFVPEGFVVVLAGYRLGEVGRYPAMLQDTAAAIAWTRENIAQFGGDPARIVLAGHSAGAYNVVQVALEDRWLAAHTMSPRDISGVIGLSGPYDFAPFESPSTIASFGHVDDAASTQPFNFARAPFVTSDTPPMLLIHGAEDTLVRPRNSRVLAEAINEAGGNALHTELAGLSHNDPLIQHAAPWRRNAQMIALTADFAHAVTLPDTPDGAEAAAAGAPAIFGEVSVPVQDETR